MPEGHDSPLDLWRRYQELLFEESELNFTLDVSRVRFPLEAMEDFSEQMGAALRAMDDLEKGGLANADEGRMVGHYWLRAPELAPSSQIRDEITRAIEQVLAFASEVLAGSVAGPGGNFQDVVHVGIGGSALGPRLICDALSPIDHPLRIHFLDNADPDGVDFVLRRLSGGLEQTLVSVVSKSGWTPTPTHVMRELEQAYASAGLRFADHAVATTMEGTNLAERATQESWLARFPLWEWVGGRTSITSAVGLLPAALAGIDVKAFLEGAAAMDHLTRRDSLRANPAALLAFSWYVLGKGHGAKNMVVLPYRDRMSLFGRYVQQLTMESVGKRYDRSGKIVEQGLTVYGTKGSTDQHSYMQQLMEGPADFFATLIYFSAAREHRRVEVENGLTLDDYLFGYLEGTRQALHERGRESITITVPAVSPISLGMLVALFERAVGLYAELIDVNAYHQPGVNKAAAAEVMRLQSAVQVYLAKEGEPKTSEETAKAIGSPEQVETVYKILARLSSTPESRVSKQSTGTSRFFDRFAIGRADNASDI